MMHIDIGVNEFGIQKCVPCTRIPLTTKLVVYQRSDFDEVICLLPKLAIIVNSDSFFRNR